jgi:ATP-dependent exoDNAse (exonuclease V) beta subunit
VRSLYASGDTLHEVPFTMLAEGTWLRGTIDCLVRHGQHHLTVLEFKTGRPRPEHEAQVDLYRRAAAQMFPGCVIDARLVYAD